MSEQDDSTNLNDGQENSHDPLGIIGWEIGGKYIIRSHIGGGGFGEVYEGYNKHLTEQRLVFKFFKRVQSRDKFAKEAKILCMLDHPNISRVVDYLPDEGAVVVAYIDGRDGGQILREQGALDEETFLKVARGVTSAIAYAHEKKIAHRDIKPGNIMFDKRGQIYLIDFGIAKEIGGDATKTAYQALTPLFAAPERQTGEANYNPFLSDIYEVAITLFNFATDSLPYRNPANPDPSEWGGTASKKLSPELRRILKKATDPDPARRYSSAAEMAAEFKKLGQAFGGTEKKGRGFIIALALVTVLVVAAFVMRDEIRRLYEENFGRKEVATRTVTPPKRTSETPITIDSSAVIAGMTDSTATADSMAAVVPDTIKKEIEKPAVESSTPGTAVKTQVDTVTKKTAEESSKETITKPKEPVKEPVKQTPQEETKVVTPPAEKKPEPAVAKTDSVKTETTSVTKPPEKKPEPPSTIPLRLAISPRGDAVLTVNGIKGTPDSTFNIKPDEDINLVVVHTDYPILNKTVKLSAGDTRLAIDLSREYAGTDSVSLQIALAPPSDKHVVELSFNGRRHMLTEFPVLNLIKLQGWWNLNSSIFAIGADKKGEPRIDSLVVFPYGSGPHGATKGPSGRIKLGSTGGSGMATVPLVIFWSEK
nr:protein kinase [candidate division Zixibacteria bacterium]